MNLQSIYDHSPIFFQNIMTSVKGYQIKRTRYGKYYYEHLQLLKQLRKLFITEFKIFKKEWLCWIFLN